MAEPTRYSIDLDVRYGPLKLIDVPVIASSVAEEWSNQTLCRVNDCVVRLGVFKRESSTGISMTGKMSSSLSSKVVS